MKKVVSLFAILLIGQLVAYAQNTTLDSYAKARPVLDRAIAAFGGIKELRAIENVSFRIEGDVSRHKESTIVYLETFEAVEKKKKD